MQIMVWDRTIRQVGHMLTPAEVGYRDQVRQQTTAAIRRWGCMVQFVSDEVECPCCKAEGLNRAERRARRGDRRLAARSTPSFAYTIGLHGVGHPELLVFGLGFEPARRLLTRLAHEVRDHGVELVPGEVVPADRALDRPLLVELLPNPWEVLIQANNYYRRPAEASVDAVQLTWPDSHGRWPGEATCTAPAANQPRPGSFRA